MRCQKFMWKPRNERKNGCFTFFCTGPRLFNSLPPEIRELDDVVHPDKSHAETFKEELDKYLATIPDIPGTQANSLMNEELRPNNQRS